jgi:hypothetical protein
LFHLENTSKKYYSALHQRWNSKQKKIIRQKRFHAFIQEFEKLMTEWRDRDRERRMLLRRRLRGPLDDAEVEQLDTINSITADWPPNNCSEGEILPALKCVAEKYPSHVHNRSIIFLSWITIGDRVLVKQSYRNCSHTIKWVKEYGWKNVQDVGCELDGQLIGRRETDGGWSVGSQGTMFRNLNSFSLVWIEISIFQVFVIVIVGRSDLIVTKTNGKTNPSTCEMEADRDQSDRGKSDRGESDREESDQI